MSPFILAFILADLTIFNPTNYSSYKLLPNFFIYVVDGIDFPCVEIIEEIPILRMYSSSNSITLYLNVYNVLHYIYNISMSYIVNIKLLYLISLYLSETKS